MSDLVPPAREPQMIPRDILTTLFRGLVYGGSQVGTREQVNLAWAWLEERNHYEEMGQ